MKIDFLWKAHENNNKSSTDRNILFTYICWGVFLFPTPPFQHSSPWEFQSNSHLTTLLDGNWCYRGREWGRDGKSMPISPQSSYTSNKGDMKKKKISSKLACDSHSKLPPNSARAFLSHELLNPVPSFVVWKPIYI